MADDDDSEAPTPQPDPRRERTKPGALTLVGGDVVRQRWTDTRCHPPSVFERDRLDRFLTRATDAGVMRLVAVGTDLDSSMAAAQVAASEPGVWATVGVHPRCLPDGDIDVAALVGDLELILLGTDVVAITASIDPDRDGADPKRQHQQQALLAAQLALAKAYDVVFVVERTERWPLALDVMRGEGMARRSLIHGFSGSTFEARRAIELGFHLAFDDRLTQPDEHELRAAAAWCPLDRLVLESGERAAASSSPARLPRVGRAVADARGSPAAEIARATWRNARELFGLR